MLKKNCSYPRSKGAVLLVSLMLLTLMTLIGVAAIDTQSLQSQMARNSFSAQNLYQLSLSEIEAQYNKLQGSDYLESVIHSETSIDENPAKQLQDSQVETHDDSDAYTQAVTISYTGDGPPPSGYSISLFKGKNFEVNSIAAIAGSGSKSDQAQGLNYPAPKN